MAEQPKTDDVEKFLAEQKAFDDRKQGLIDDLLRQKAEAVKAFDERLAKLGYRASGRPKRNHHKQAEPAKPKPKA
jgi:hypothetical protein